MARARKKPQPFNVNTFLSKADGGRTVTSYRTNKKIFSQGDPADAAFYRLDRVRRPGRHAAQLRGFGTHVMEKIIGGQLGGQVRLDWRDRGLICEIALPLQRP